jgi:hypothetical protein
MSCFLVGLRGGICGQTQLERDTAMKIILARPRGFCAGVERAINCVEMALDQFGPPVYVLNDIVHNAAVVNTLKDKGAVFVKDMNDVPCGSHLLFSAHGVGPDRWEKAKERSLDVIDATCPLVAKVHNEARRFASKDYTIILVGEVAMMKSPGPQDGRRRISGSCSPMRKSNGSKCPTSPRWPSSPKRP